jgi:cell wall-associated NlpC family hydrolase
MPENRICAIPVAPLHVEPHSTSERDSEVLAGEPVEVLERRPRWVRVRTVYGHEGWIADDALGDAGEASAWPPGGGSEPLEQARRYLGARYLWGGMTEHGIDCSGLVHMAHRAAGRLVPRDADEQEAAGTPLAEDELRPGDVITYGEDGAERATHVAFWLGQGRILHATSAAGRVLEEAEPPALRALRRKLVRL